MLVKYEEIGYILCLGIMEVFRILIGKVRDTTNGSSIQV